MILNQKLALWLFVLSLPLAVGGLSGGDQKAATGQNSTPKGQIDKLISDLGDKNFIIREKATHELGQIGLPALDALNDALKAADPEVRSRAQALITQIRYANRLPTIVDGLEFKLTIEKQWAVPKPGQETRIKGSFQITNKKKEVCNLFLVYTAKVVLRTETGKAHPSKNGRFSSPRLTNGFIALKENGTVSKDFSGQIGHNKIEKQFLTFTYGGQDLVWEPWGFPQIVPGSIQFSVVYENRRQKAPEGQSLWVGRAETLSETVELK